MPSDQGQEKDRGRGERVPALLESSTSAKHTLILPDWFGGYLSEWHKACPNREFSGAFVYSVEGNMEAGLKMRMDEFCMLDIGTPGNTEYDAEDSPEIFRMNCRISMEILKGKDLRLGDFHTHHTMGTYFSGTDLKLLAGHSRHFQIFLMLIANQKMEMEARVSNFCEYDKPGVGKIEFAVWSPVEVIFESCEKVKEEFSKLKSRIAEKTKSEEPKSISMKIPFPEYSGPKFQSSEKSDWQVWEDDLDAILESALLKKLYARQGSWQEYQVEEFAHIIVSGMGMEAAIKEFCKKSGKSGMSDKFDKKEIDQLQQLGQYLDMRQFQSEKEKELVKFITHKY